MQGLFNSQHKNVPYFITILKKNLQIYKVLRLI